MNRQRKAGLLEQAAAMANEKARDNGGRGNPALGPAYLTAANAVAAGRPVPKYAEDFIKQNGGKL
ncbi:MAG: hypothetical protein ACRCV9_03610 [Burkholderiaceae bacterium]